MQSVVWGLSYNYIYIFSLLTTLLFPWELHGKIQHLFRNFSFIKIHWSLKTGLISVPGPDPDTVPSKLKKHIWFHYLLTKSLHAKFSSKMLFCFHKWECVYFCNFFFYHGWPVLYIYSNRLLYCEAAWQQRLFLLQWCHLVLRGWNERSTSACAHIL